MQAGTYEQHVNQHHGKMRHLIAKFKFCEKHTHPSSFKDEAFLLRTTVNIVDITVAYKLN
jgi:hypothetical protein